MFRGIRTTILLLVALALMPAIGLSYYIAEQARDEHIATAQRDLSLALRQLATRERLRIEANRQILDALSHTHEILGDDTAVCSTYLDNLYRRLTSRPDWKDFGDFVRIGADGLVNCATTNIPIGTNVADRAYFNTVMRTQSFAMSDFVLTRAGNRPILILAEPVLDDAGNLRHVITVGLYVSWLEGFLRDTHLPEGSAVTMVSGNGEIFARYPKREATKPTSDHPFLTQVLKGPPAPVETWELDGRRVIVGVYKIPDTTVMLALSVPYDDIMGKASGQFYLVIKVTALITFTALLFAWLLAHATIITKLDALTRTARKLHEGDFTARSTVAHDDSELGQLAKTFDGMADEIERKVVARTHDLEVSHDNLNLAQRIAHLGSWTWNIQTGEEVWSDEQFRIFGYEPGSIEAHYELFTKALHPDDRDEVFQAIDETLQGRAPYDCTFGITRPNGDVRHIRAQGEVKRTADGTPTFMTGTVLDITEAMHSQQERAKLSRVIEQSPHMVLITDAEGIIEYVNPKFCELTGYSREEAIGETPRIIRSSHTGADTHRAMWAAIKAGRDWQGEVLDQGKDGEPLWLSVTLSPMRNPRGQITHIVGMQEDISRRKQIELDMLRAKEQAEVANRAKSELLANMSHELRTPLNAIIGYSEALRSGVFGPMQNERQSEYLGDIQNSGSHLLQLINDILDVSAIEAGKLDLHEEPFSLIDTADACMRLVKPRAEKGEVTLTRGPMIGVHSIYGDHRRIKQVLINLLSNAVKFTNPGGRIEINAGILENGNCAIWVKDNGIGMSPQDLQKALLPFGQADSGLDRKYEGTGLGLPLSKSLVSLHGGTITVESALGEGTIVTVILPRQRVQTNREA